MSTAAPATNDALSNNTVSGMWSLRRIIHVDLTEKGIGIHAL